MCTVHDDVPELARLSRLRKSQIKGLLVASSTVSRVPRACKLGLEGIVSKHPGSPYRSGRSRHWVKSKNPAAPAVKREAEEDQLLGEILGTQHHPVSTRSGANLPQSASAGACWRGF